MPADRRAVLQRFIEKKSYMEDRISTGIEAGRKGFVTLRLTDTGQKPAAGAKVRLRQRTHDFRYGANLFMLDGFASEAENQAYRRHFADAFNIATLPFYWDAQEPEPGRPRYAKDSPAIYRRPPPDLCLEFCEANGIEPKAHCLNYESFTPKWVFGSVEKEKRLLVKRFAELSGRYAARIPSWEVTNETFWGTKRGRLNFYDEPDYVEWSFANAERHFPANRLIINEAHCRIWDHVSHQGRRSPYFLQIERALSQGARIDGIGMQFHMFIRAEQEVAETAQFYDPERLYDIMDLYASFGVPLQITELTIPAYARTDADEELQAEIIRTLYRMWFSHPAMEAVIYWNLIDGYTYGTAIGDMTGGENYYHGGLLRFDGTPKPAYHAIRELFSRTWRTELAAEADADGRIAFKGFYGDYDLEIEHGGRLERRSFHLGKGVRRQDLQV